MTLMTVGGWFSVCVVGMTVGTIEPVEGAATAVLSRPPPDGAALATTDRSPPDTDVRRRPTAEELLRSLRRNRPVYDVIPPASAAQDVRRAAPSKLFPEGFVIVDQSGRLGRDGSWWTFVFDASDELVPMKLLPNTSLEVMVRTTRGAAKPIRFRMSGEMTVFEGENYLLARVATRITDGSETTHPMGADQAKDQVPADATADQVLAVLQAQQPKQPLLQSLSTLAGDDVMRRSATAALTVMGEGTTLVRRPGRLIRQRHWWTFVFESDHPDQPEPPIKLLPNKSVELMAQTSARGNNGLVFLLTGDVTLFEGENFLLPRIAIRRIDSGNLTK